jgi:hypothetical protein
MSQERSYKTTIKIPQLPKVALVHGDLSVEENPALDLLRKAVEEAVAERSGSVNSTYLDCHGRRHRAWISAHTADFKRGVGLTINEEGRVGFHYDSATAVNEEQPELAGQVRFIYDRADTARQLCADIVSRYVTLAAKRALGSLQCTVRIETTEEQRASRPMIRGTDSSGRERVLSVGPQGEVYVDFRGFTANDCVSAERALRERFAAFGLELETTWHRLKNVAAPAGFSNSSRTEVGA